MLAFYDKNVKANIEENVFNNNELNKILPNQTQGMDFQFE